MKKNTASVDQNAGRGDRMAEAPRRSKRHRDGFAGIKTMTLLFIFFSHFCTASIISPRALLTAAHCIGINTNPPNNFTAVVGINGK